MDISETRPIQGDICSTEHDICIRSSRSLGNHRPRSGTADLAPGASSISFRESELHRGDSISKCFSSFYTPPFSLFTLAFLLDLAAWNG